MKEFTLLKKDDPHQPSAPDHPRMPVPFGREPLNPSSHATGTPAPTAAPASEPSPSPAPAPRIRDNVRSHFVFGPGFTQALLIICILMLGVIIGMKMSDYFHGREMEQSELALLRATQPAPVPAAPAPQVVMTPPPAPQPPQQIPVVAAPTQTLTVPSGYPAQALQASTAPPAPSASSAQASADYSNQLAALQQERDLMRQRFDSLNAPAGSRPSDGPAASGSTTSGPLAAGDLNGTSSLPSPRGGRPSSKSLMTAPSDPADALRAAAAGAGAVSPPPKEVSAAEQRIRDAPALGKVIEYDADWHFVIINCGTKHNLEAGRKLAIRRGGTILGLIRVDEILPEQSVAELDGEWKIDPQALKPQPGDDVLTFPPF